MRWKRAISQVVRDKLSICIVNAVLTIGILGMLMIWISNDIRWSSLLLLDMILMAIAIIYLVSYSNDDDTDPWIESRFTWLPVEIDDRYVWLESIHIAYNLEGIPYGRTIISQDRYDRLKEEGIPVLTCRSAINNLIGGKR